MPRRVPAPIERAMLDIAEELSLARRQQRIPMEVLASRCTVSRSTLSRMLNQGEGSLENFLRVARCLGFLDRVVKSVDPLNTDIGRIRAMGDVPRRVG